MNAAYASGIQPCAIRWDAWYDARSSSVKAQQSLSDPKWINRAPVHCEVKPKNSLKCVGTQRVIDEEIIGATQLASLDCWAFVQYSDESSLSLAWNLFQSSGLREQMKWAWITYPAMFGNDAARQKYLESMTEQLAQTNYLRVDVGEPSRPVLFILWNDNQFRDTFHNDYDEFSHILLLLSERVRLRGRGTPYYVILRGDPQRAAEIARKVGASAISSYNVPVAIQPDHSYRSLSAQTRKYWIQQSSTGVPFIPIVMTGFDQRPMLEHSMDSRDFDAPPKPFYYPATNDELVKELLDSFQLARSNPELIPSKIVLIYSWNENAEGGGSLNETIGDPTGERLRAFRKSHPYAE
jgi:hypothetical protein